MPTTPSLRFDNAFVTRLPGDPETGRHVRAVEGALWSPVAPEPVAAPRMLAWSADMAGRLGLDPAWMSSAAAAEVLAGNRLLEGMAPFASNYGGHQFGHWAGQLGDGRAIGLGEVLDPGGHRWELQLKGAGSTPYSRSADGRAVLRSSLREFLCSEAMHHLGVPTTRALSLVGTGEPVVRDMFYDGHPAPEPGAVVCRVAPSFIRFGHFELPASRGDVDLLRTLVDFCIARDFPHLHGTGEALLGDWFGEVCERTAVMVAHWMRVGFVHGVMNTDNMSILGLTIDYGPYGWIDDFDPDWTPNTTDRQHRRYRFGQQPQVAYWNLSRLAGALSPLFGGHEALQAGLRRFVEAYGAADRGNTAAKLGLSACRDEDVDLMQALRDLLKAGEVDMTLFFRQLADIDPDAPSLDGFDDAFYDASRRASVEGALGEWLRTYAARVAGDPLPAEHRKALMDAANPQYVLRNYLAQEAIDLAHGGDMSRTEALLALLSHPYDAQPGREGFARRRPDWARDRAGCSMLSCSS
ncbi:protein adenylyltransferase SelO [Marilutibacter spongiae]|nr:YdiU family protein [Lysobacter spongiae]